MEGLTLASQSSKRAARDRVEQMRREQQKKDQRQRRFLLSGTVFVIALIIGGAVWGISRVGGDETLSGELPSVVADGRSTEQPWGLPVNPSDLAESVDLRVQPMEGTAKHFHAHLDVIINGEPVTVPANIGIDPAGTGMSELHTHDERGVLHVEAPTDDMRYTLGQVFAQWDVRLDKSGIGGYDVDDANTMRAYVDGELFEGNPTDIELLEHSQIALVYGPKDEGVEVPDSFEFQPNE